MKNAKDIFNKKIAPLMKGKNSDEIINIFSKTSKSYFYNLPPMKRLTERQKASAIGFKDEYFVEAIINYVISENNLEQKFYCKKVTANEYAGIKSRSINIAGKKINLTIGGDCVIFNKKIDEPILAIECKEYIDMIRMKELIGESRVIKDIISNSTLNFPNIKFWVFAEVLELTEGWAYLFNNSDLKYRVDKVFIARDGKRKDVNNSPKKSELIRFRDELKSFLAGQP